MVRISNFTFLKKNRLFVSLALSMIPVLGSAQSDTDSISAASIIAEFNSFRSDVVEEFDEFQRAVLNEYISFTGGKLEKADNQGVNVMPDIPKPSVPPKWKSSHSISRRKDIVDVDTDVVSGVEVVTAEKVQTESFEILNRIRAAVMAEIDTAVAHVAPIVAPIVAPLVAPAEEAAPIEVPKIDSINIEIYGLELSWPSIDMADLSYNSPGLYWNKVKKMVDTSRLIESIRQSALQYSLGSWCTLLAVNKYAEQILDEQNTPAVMTLTHYLMSEVGYDLILGILNGNDTRLFIPFDQDVYDTSYTDQNNRKYYIYPKRRSSHVMQISLVKLPESDDSEKLSFNLVVNPSFLLPHDDIDYSITDSIIHLQGAVNGNLINLMKDYPLMDTEYYAMSTADSTMRKQIIDVLRPQIEGLSPNDAANALLHFIHQGFEYQTDGEQFGVEKPFFMEEIFYYPFCDCEDRSILYAYLVHNLLGLDVVLLSYPGHACTGVALPKEPKKTKYSCVDFEGQRYYVCDPTYIGSDIGQSQPNFEGMTPRKIAKWY